MGMARIAPLPQQLASALRSSSILSSVQQVIDELVCNSIDAMATQIIVFLDIRACYIRVEDDGCGITREDFAVLGEKNATSKLRCLDELETGVKTLGFRGEGLSSVSDIGLVEITSRAKGSPHTFRKIFKNCKTLSIGLTTNQRNPGTTVVVKDAFYNQPVRKKILHSNPRKVRDSVKNHILRLCLVHPKIQFTLVDLEREENMFRAKPASSLSSRISDMFGDESRNSLQKIDFAQGSYRLAGYISKEIKQFPVKAFQFLYINRRPVIKTPLHKVLSSWPMTQWESIGNPAFVLNLVCPLVEYDITIDASKSYVVFKDWKPVLAFAEEVTRKLWDARDSNPRPGTNRKPEAKRKRELTEYADDAPELPAPMRKTSKTVFARRSSSAPPFCKPRRKLASYGISDDIWISYDDLLKQSKTRKIQTVEYQDQALCKWRQIPIRPGQNTFASIEKPILQIGSGSLSGSSFQPGSITKEMLLGAKVLGQVDRKFIAAVTNGVLFFIDQHAADERVRLEEFRDDVFSAKEGHRVSLGDNAEDVALTRSELDVLATYRERIEYWGWCSTSVYSHGRSSEMCTIVLTTVPCIKGVKLTSKDLLEYIRQLADTHGSSSPPPAVLRVLNFKACRGAIMFGDFLLRTECEQLVNALKKTSLCFQCAHGRPTMVPIVNLETVRRHRWQSPRNGFQLPAFRNKALFPGRD